MNNEFLFHAARLCWDIRGLLHGKAIFFIFLSHRTSGLRRSAGTPLAPMCLDLQREEVPLDDDSLVTGSKGTRANP